MWIEHRCSEEISPRVSVLHHFEVNAQTHDETSMTVGTYVYGIHLKKLFFFFAHNNRLKMLQDEYFNEILLLLM